MCPRLASNNHLICSCVIKSRSSFTACIVRLRRKDAEGGITLLGRGFLAIFQMFSIGFKSGEEASHGAGQR